MPETFRAPRPLLLTAAFAGALGLAGCAAGTSATATLEASFADALAAEAVPGGVLTVRTSDGDEIGIPIGDADADGTPVDEDTLFAYRSVTKSFVVTALLQAAESGLIDLEATAPVVTGAPETTATPWELAAMTSGVPSYSSQPELVELILEDPERSWTDADLYALVDGLPPVFAPGTSYQYSNTNTLLIGDILADATGLSWSDLVADGILTEAGLDSIVYPGDALPPEGAAVGFEVDDGVADELFAVRTSSFGASGGYFGTGADLAAWAEILGSGSALTAGMQAERLESFGPTSADPQSPEYDAYGLGIGRIGDWIGHTGSGLGYQALAMYHPETGTAVSIVINATGTTHDLPVVILEALEDEILAVAD